MYGDIALAKDKQYPIFVATPRDTLRKFDPVLNRERKWFIEF